MKISKTVFTLAAVIMASAGISAANAAENGEIKNSAVLFKIHDIVPVKNSEGETIGCDYSATFFNRSNLIIRNTNLDFSWKDTAIEGVIDQEKKEDAAKNEHRGRARSVTERNTDKVVTASLDVPTLKPTKQVTVKSRVNTDRCFLLLDEVKTVVRSCDSENAQGASENKGRGEGNCSRMFTFVSSDDPQYYREFKVISLDEEKSEAEAKKAKQVSETEEMYKKAVNSLDSAASIISGIK